VHRSIQLVHFGLFVRARTWSGHPRRPTGLPGSPWMPTDQVRGLKAHWSSPAVNEKVNRLSGSEH
jgi:hypothetical protein